MLFLSIFSIFSPLVYYKKNAFKKLYPDWILESLTRGGQYDTLPPQTFYRYTYKTPHGHYMSMGGIERIN